MTAGRHQRVPLLLLVGALMLAVPPLLAQAPAGFGICVPRGQQPPGTIGCFTIVDQPVGMLDSAPVFWFVARLPSGDSDAGALPAGATRIDAFDQHWLMVIGPAHARPSLGTLVATIGPLPIARGPSYSALYMEASMRPGMKSAIHRHSGPEAWYTLDGETCLETPTQTMVGRSDGPPVIVPGGQPMELTATGTTVRRSLVLILHESAKPPTMLETSWKPQGRCAAPR